MSYGPDQILEGEGKSDYERYLKLSELLKLQPTKDAWKHRDELLFTVVHLPDAFSTIVINLLMGCSKLFEIVSPIIADCLVIKISRFSIKTFLRLAEFAADISVALTKRAR